MEGSANAKQTRISGGLIKKIHRHVVMPRITPPINGAITAAILPKAVQRPIACERSSEGKLVVMIDSAPGTSRAPKMPWMTRNPISRAVVGATAHRREVMPNPINPVTYTFFLPKISPNDPPMRISDDNESR
jgi:hypothetical protein